MYGGIVSRDDDNARPLLDEHAALFERERGSWTLGRVTRYAGATAIGALIVAAGFIASDPSHPALQKFRGLSKLGAESGAATPAIHRAATRRAAPTPAHHHRLGSLDADAVGRLGGDDIAHIDALDEQVARLTRELTAARSENVELEKQVQSLEQSIVDTREEFLKIGHGGRSKHLAGSHDNEIIADLENQLKDKHYELEKTRQQKYKLYIKNNECNAAQAELDKTIADCKKNMFEYAERADALERMESCSAEKAALTTKLSTANEKLETALADLAAARGDDHDDNARIVSLESKLGECQDQKDSDADTIAGFRSNAESDKLELSARQRLVDELTAKAAASDALADRLKSEVAQLVEDVQACELDGKSFDFFCAGEGETCECPDGDIVWGPRYHASDKERANTFADVIATQNFIVHKGTAGFACTNEHVGGDPESGEAKACFCAPRGLNYAVKPSVDGATPTPASEPVKAAPEPPAPAVVEAAVVDVEDIESYEDALESAPAPAMPEVEAVDVAGGLETQFEETVGDDTIREVETDAETRDESAAETPKDSNADANADSHADSPDTSPKGEDWKKYEEEDVEDLYEALDKNLPEGSYDDADVEDVAARINAENAAAAKAKAEAEAAAEKAFGECQAMCAAEQECCNIDIVQGSNQRLSCLQACTMVKGGVTIDRCNAECANPTCERTVNGITYRHCAYPGCGDVPAHKDAFGDKFQPAPYECAARWGTDDNSCKKGCLNGVTEYDAFKAKKAAEAEAKAKAEAEAKAKAEAEAKAKAEAEAKAKAEAEAKAKAEAEAKAAAIAKCGACGDCDYELTTGDIGGWGARRAGGSTRNVASAQDCAKLCSENDNCLSYEYSPTSKICNRNDLADPTGKNNYLDYLFCSNKAASKAAAEAEKAFGDCQAMCAAEHECCNNDIRQGSNARLSCLQACHLVKTGGVSEDQCLGECSKSTCFYNVGDAVPTRRGYPTCTVCDDVPGHKGDFGDKFKPAPYQCSAGHGTSEDGCKKGCSAGVTDYEALKAKQAAEPEYAAVREGSCEDYGMTTIMDEITCKKAGAVIDNQPDKILKSVYTPIARPKGCTLHPFQRGSAQKPTEFFRNGRVDGCGAGCDCLCIKNPKV